jgi:hypothetical protein
MDTDFKIGVNYCFFIPPGWIIVGKLARVTDAAIFLDDAFHLENVADGVSSLAVGLADKIEKAVTKSYPLPAGVRIDLRGALISSPCEIDITKLSLAHAVAAIKGRK